MRVFPLLMLVLAMAGCAHRMPRSHPTPRTLVLSYSDFGPQAAAYRLIGFEWYQWDAHGDYHPETRYNVRVVVYDRMPLQEVQRQYPVVKSKLQDYRYLLLREAIDYIDANARDLPALLATRKRLVSYFGYGKSSFAH
jgi:hypothetical protein